MNGIRYGMNNAQIQYCQSLVLSYIFKNESLMVGTFYNTYCLLDHKYLLPIVWRSTQVRQFRTCRVSRYFDEVITGSRVPRFVAIADWSPDLTNRSCNCDLTTQCSVKTRALRCIRVLFFRRLPVTLQTGPAHDITDHYRPRPAGHSVRDSGTHGDHALPPGTATSFGLSSSTTSSLCLSAATEQVRHSIVRSTMFLQVTRQFFRRLTSFTMSL